MSGAALAEFLMNGGHVAAIIGPAGEARQAIVKRVAAGLPGKMLRVVAPLSGKLSAARVLFQVGGVDQGGDRTETLVQALGFHGLGQFPATLVIEEADALAPEVLPALARLPGLRSPTRRGVLLVIAGHNAFRRMLESPVLAALDDAERMRVHWMEGEPERALAEPEAVVGVVERVVESRGGLEVPLVADPTPLSPPFQGGGMAVVCADSVGAVVPAPASLDQGGIGGGFEPVVGSGAEPVGLESPLVADDPPPAPPFPGGEKDAAADAQPDPPGSVLDLDGYRRRWAVGRIAGLAARATKVTAALGAMAAAVALTWQYAPAMPWSTLAEAPPPSAAPAPKVAPAPAAVVLPAKPTAPEVLFRSGRPVRAAHPTVAKAYVPGPQPVPYDELRNQAHRIPPPPRPAMRAVTRPLGISEAQLREGFDGFMDRGGASIPLLAPGARQTLFEEYLAWRRDGE